MTRSRRTSRGLRRNRRQHHELRPLLPLRQSHGQLHSQLHDLLLRWRHLLRDHNRSSRYGQHLRHDQRQLHGLRLKSGRTSILDKGF